MQLVNIGKSVVFSEPTTAVFLSPLTARELRLTHGQLVAVFEPSIKNRSYNAENGEQEGPFSTKADDAELANGRPKVKTSRKRVVVRAVQVVRAFQQSIRLQAVQTMAIVRRLFTQS